MKAYSAILTPDKDEFSNNDNQFHIVDIDGTIVSEGLLDTTTSLLIININNALLHFLSEEDIEHTLVNGEKIDYTSLKKLLGF